MQVKSLQHSFIIQHNTHFSSVHSTHLSTLPWCTACSQNFQLTSLPVSQYTVHKMRRLTIQLCQYQYPSSNNDWLVHNELEWTWKEVVTAYLQYYCNICLKGQRKANGNLSGRLVPWTRFTSSNAIWTNPFSRFVQYYPLSLSEQVPYSHPSLPQYVHTLAVTTIHCRYIYCMPASAIIRTAISTALHLTKYNSVDVHAQSKVRGWASYCSEDPK